MKLNLQQTLGDVNPFYAKYVQDGQTPATYISKSKRREMYEYMTKSTLQQHGNSAQTVKTTTA